MSSHGRTAKRQKGSLNRVANAVLLYVAVPLTLLPASWLRYNLISLLYLLLLLVLLVLPTPIGIKCKKYSANMVCFGVLFLVSLIGTLGQPLFQISILRNYQYDYCSSPWRQIGFIQFQLIWPNTTGHKSIPSVDIVRNYLPDVVVFLITVVTMAIMAHLSKEVSNTEAEPQQTIEGERMLQTSAEQGLVLPNPPSDTKPTSDHCWVVAHSCLDLAIFVMTGACGVSVPSLTSMVYFLLFLLRATLWALHFDRWTRLWSAVRVLLLIYTGCHLVMVYLYQFEKAQELIPLQPTNTTSSLLGRLFGLTPFVCTSCSRPTELIACPNVPSNYIINPILLFVLYWMLAIKRKLYYPKDSTKSTAQFPFKIARVSSSDRVIQAALSMETMPAAHNQGAVVETPQMKRLYEKLEDLVSGWKNTAFQVFKVANFIFSIIAMMLWSVLYPCWPSLALLLWASIIWIIPRLSPKLSLYWSSPLLVLYTVGLVCLQYLYSLDGPDLPTNGSFIVIGSRTQDKSLQLAIEAIFVMIFCASLWRARAMQKSGGGDDEGTASTLQHLLSACGGLVVLGAFLLVILVGEPSWLKTVYIVVFYASLLIYQLFSSVLQPSRSYYLVVPLLYVMVLYAILHLLVVYTAQLETIHSLWLQAFGNSTVFNVDDTLQSIGILKSTYTLGDTRFLLETLVPLVVFIAALALQLGYYTPQQQSHQPVPGGRNPALRIFLECVTPSNAASPGTTAHSTRDHTPERVTPVEESVHPRVGATSAITEQLYERGRSLVSALQLQQWGLSLVRLVWRFLALHAHKGAMLTLFVVSLSQISAAYLVLLLMAAVASPLPRFYRVLYPVISLYLGLVVVAKMIYQAPLLNAQFVNLTTICNTSDMQSNVIGAVFNDQYSPSTNYPSWFGLHKVTSGSHFGSYIAGPIIAVLVLSLWMFAQEHYKGTTALFPGILRTHADQSLANACRYLANNFLEMYGLEACCSMLAVAVAVRVDVYGVFYALVLGVLMLVLGVSMMLRHRSVVVPRPLQRVLFVFWCSYLLVHGVLLGVQYALLLGVPLGTCASSNIGGDYPWSNMSTPLKKWLFLTEANQHILDKNVLYVDILVYLLLCFQLPYICPSTNDHHDETDSPQCTLFNPEQLFYYIKLLIFQYGFWLTLLLLFLMATLQISLFGCLYLGACFAFMLCRHSLVQHKHWLVWWYGIRTLSWVILLFRVCLQILDCVLISDSNCTYLILLNGGCSRQQYYGSSQKTCNAHNTGLWTEAFCFILVTLQLIVLDTKYACTTLININSILRSTRPPARHNASLRRRQIEDSLKADNQYLETSKARVLGFLKTHGYIEEGEDQEKVHETWLDEMKALWLQGFDVLMMKAKYLVDLRADRATGDTATVARMTCDTTSGTAGVTSGTAGVTSSMAGVTRGTEVTRGTAGVTSGTAGVTSGTAGVTSSTAGVTSGTAGVTSGTAGVTSGTAGVTSGTAGVTSGTAGVTSGTAGVTSGTAGVTSGTAGVTSGTAGVTSGTAGVTSGTAGVTIGTAGVTSGTAGVTSGTAETNTGITGITACSTATADTLAEITIGTPSEAFGTAANIAGMSGPFTLGTTSPTTTTTNDRVATTEFDGTPRVLEPVTGSNIATGDRDTTGLGRTRQLLSVLYDAILSHVDYIIYFLVVINVLQNGSVFSLFYMALVFIWGLGPWPNPSWKSRAFWTVLLLYAMLVVTIKYVILFWTSDSYWIRAGFGAKDGLYFPLILFGIRYDYSPLHVIVWDVMVLVAILAHQTYLKNRGLWRDNPDTNSVRSALEELFDKNSGVSPFGKDYYTIMLCFDILTFITIVFGASSFGVGVLQQDVRQVFSLISRNSVPLGFVISLLLQFLFIMADRAIYMHHSIRAKFVFHLFLLLIWHTWLFFVLPAITLRPFADNVAAQLVYFFKCAYFVVSSLQIKACYPDHNIRWFLDINYAKPKQQFATIKSAIFSVYRWVPLLPELKEMTDWVFTDSGLSLTQWLTVEEIWSSLYPTRLVQNQDENEPQKIYSRGKKRLHGGGLVLMFLLLIWGPLFFFSVAAEEGALNPANGVTLTVSIAGFPNLITVNQENITALSDNQYQTLKDVYKDNLIVYPQFAETFVQENFQRALISSQSTSTWTISPPARQQLVETFQGALSNPEEGITLDISWSINRSPVSSVALSQLSGHRSTFLNIATDEPTLEGFLCLLNRTAQGCNGSTQQRVILYNLFPRYLYAPNTGEAENFTLADYGNGSVDCTLTLSSSGGLEWWTLGQSSPFILTSYKGVELFVYSDKVVSNVLGSVASYGVIGLYLSVVVVIGELIRSNVTDLPKSLIYDELSDSTPHMKLLSCIHLARYRRRFDLEKSFTKMLFAVMRSPERIIAFEKMTFE